MTSLEYHTSVYLEYNVQPPHSRAVRRTKLSIEIHVVTYLHIHPTLFTTCGDLVDKVYKVQGTRHKVQGTRYKVYYRPRKYVPNAKKQPRRYSEGARERPPWVYYLDHHPPEPQANP